MKYVCTVEAVQWTGQDLSDVKVDRDIYHGFSAGHSYKGYKIHEGDWIVKFPNFKEAVMSNAEFTSLYNPYYGNLPVDKELASLYNRISELDNEVSYARFGGKSF
jgi:hypothetical protein